MCTLPEYKGNTNEAHSYYNRRLLKPVLQLVPHSIRFSLSPTAARGGTYKTADLPNLTSGRSDGFLCLFTTCHNRILSLRTAHGAIIPAVTDSGLSLDFQTDDDMG